MKGHYLIHVHFFSLYYFSQKQLNEQMRILQLAISKSAQNEIAARALLENLSAIIHAIGKVSRNWATVMDNIKD